MGRTAFGERLVKAISLPGGPGSIRKFQELLESEFGPSSEDPRERFGYSYPSINSYLQEGGATPTIEWVGEVARLLNVSPLWLAFGVGPMRSWRESLAGDFNVARLTGPGRGNTRTRQEILSGLRRGIGQHRVSAGALVSLEQVFWSRWGAQEEHLPPDRLQSVRQLAESIGRAAVAPLRELGMDPGARELWELEAFLPMMYSPLHNAAWSFGAEEEDRIDEGQE